ncbi:MAG: hypothetical protein H6869_08645 [Rhodospirillales bacterium]|nr:hypothetical protein [Rhodospirillales bacterium]
MKTLRQLFSKETFKTPGGKLSAAVFGAFALAAAYAAGQDHDVPLTIMPSHTPHSQYMQEMNSLFRDANPDHKIVIIDRDWMVLNAAVNRIDPKDEKQMGRLLGRYIEDNLGFRLTSESLENMLEEPGEESPLAMVLGHEHSLRNHKDEPNPVCVVYPVPHTTDADGALRSMLQYAPSTYGRLFDPAISSHESRENILETVDFHEVAGHCLDNKYVPEKDAIVDAARSGKSPQIDDYIIATHKSETFADVMGLLMQVKEKGTADMAQPAADRRMVIAAFTSTATTRKAASALVTPTQGNSFGLFIPGKHDDVDEDFLIAKPVMGVIYMTVPALDEAVRYIDTHGVAAIQTMSHDELRAAAEKIVDDNALTLEEMLVIFNAMKDPGYFDMVKQKRHDDPDFVEPYDTLKFFYQRAELAVNRVLGKTTKNASLECRADEIVAAAPEQDSVPDMKNSGCGYAYSYADIRPAVPDDKDMAQWEAMKRQQIIMNAEALHREIVQNGGDAEAIAQSFHNAQSYYNQMMQMDDPQARMAASMNLQILPDALNLAVLYVKDNVPVKPPLPPFMMPMMPGPGV